MTTRVLSGVMLLPLLLTIIIGNLPLYLLGLVLTIVAINEFTKALKVKDIDIFPVLGYVISVCFFIKNIYSLTANSLAVVIILLVILAFVYALLSKKNIKYFLLNLIGIFYILFGFDAIISIVDTFNNGHVYVWLIFIASSLSDTMAYFVGSYFGKHKLAPKLSPKKTIEGSVGAIFFSTIGCVIFGMVFSLNIWLVLFIGFTGSIASQIGDLLASFVKRYVGIKDYGNIIPGHGGILDRCDSIILVSQYIYIILALTSVF